MTDPGNLASTSSARAASPGMDTIWKAAAYGELSLVQVKILLFETSRVI